MFDFWEKVSYDRGEYRGSNDIAFQKTTVRKSNGDTIAIDTSYVNSDEQLSISVEPYSHSDEDYDFQLTVIDSSIGGQYLIERFKTEYVSDSTAFHNPRSGDKSSNKEQYSSIRTRLIYNCHAMQDDHEILRISYSDFDSTYINVYEIRADGMIDIVDDLISCR
jgi:hypothetical protein